MQHDDMLSSGKISSYQAQQWSSYLHCPEVSLNAIIAIKMAASSTRNAAVCHQGALATAMPMHSGLYIVLLAH
jgi:hypothetical protein